MWHHQNPLENKRAALAPYNFVPLPERVLRVDDDVRFKSGEEAQGTNLWQCHDRFVPGAHSGWINVKITTLTPLFIRGQVRRSNGEWDTHESRVREMPACDVNGRPIIPGSSLRGILRTLVEILGFAKVQPVSKQRPFFRTVQDDRIGKEYRNRIVRGNKKPLGGFVHRQGTNWIIVPARVLRVAHETVPGLQYRFSPKYKPDWTLQHKNCWVTLGEHDDVSDLKFEEQPGWIKGTLVLTGSAPPNKEGKDKREFVFLPPGDDPSIEIKEDLWTRFHDDDQISGWQKDAFPKGKPEGAERRMAGALRDGEPVFYVCDDAGALLFFGRAQLFRFPYDLSPADLIPPSLREDGVDLAEAMFGRIDDDSPGGTIKGRVRVEDAVAQTAGDALLEEIIVPHILSSPKPTTFAQYLVQNGTRDKRLLNTYLKADSTQIRGHKLYWHRWDDAKGLEAVKEPGYTVRGGEIVGPDGHASTQHTRIRPVRRQVTFSGKIRFENLTSIELGALVTALRLPAGCAHKLGMGKPLGLGSVAIEPRLALINRERRYASWQDDGTDRDSASDVFEQAFAQAIVAHATASGERFAGDEHGLWSIARLEVLRLLLGFDGRPTMEETRYNKIEKGDAVRYGTQKEFSDRPVLPTPHGVMNRDDPWKGDHPPPDPPQPPDVEHGQGAAGGPKAPRKGAAGGRQVPPKPQPPRTNREPAELEVGKPVLCRLTDKTTKKGGQIWEIVGPGGEAVIHKDSKPLPEGVVPGAELKMLVKAPPTRQGPGQVAYEPEGTQPHKPERSAQSKRKR
jgi:CRISPR-associated protein (TIGR03986 family)